MIYISIICWFTLHVIGCPLVLGKNTNTPIFGYGRVMFANMFNNKYERLVPHKTLKYTNKGKLSIKLLLRKYNISLAASAPTLHKYKKKMFTPFYRKFIIFCYVYSMRYFFTPKSIIYPDKVRCRKRNFAINLN